MKSKTDASIEARATAAKDIYDATVDAPTDEADLRGWLAVVRAVDASRPERTFPRVALSTVKPGSLIEVASGDAGLVLDGPTVDGQRPIAWIGIGHVGTMPAGATVSLRATSDELYTLTSADASRPGLTEEQMRAVVRRAIAEKSKQGMANMRVCIAEHELTCAVAAALLRASRGETGPAPTWGEQAIAEHHRAADLTDAGEAPIPLVLTDSAREADIQRDRANALQRALQACEVDLVTARTQLAQTERAAGAHIATIEALREQIAAAHRAVHVRAPVICPCGHTKDRHNKFGCVEPLCLCSVRQDAIDPGPAAIPVLQAPGVRAADVIPDSREDERPGVAAVDPPHRIAPRAVRYAAVMKVSAEIDAAADDPPPTP